MNYYQIIVKGSMESAMTAVSARLPSYLLVKTRPFYMGESNLIISTDLDRNFFEERLITWYHEFTLGQTLPPGSLLWWKHITAHQAGRN